MEANRMVLEDRSPSLAAWAAGLGQTAIVIESARSGGAIFRLGGRLFHSAYAPEREAETQAREIMSKKPDWTLLFGLGCGHLAKALLKGGMDKVLVYEPSREILAAVLAKVDLSEVLGAPGVEVFTDLPAFISRVRELDGFDSLLLYSTEPYKQAFPAEFMEFNNRVNNAHITNKVGIKTDIVSRVAWVNNYFANLRYLPDCPPVDVLRGAFKGVPMVIAGAGPSLRKNAALLKDLKGKAVIAAAITAYKPLLKYGVVPDFIIASEKVDLPEYFTYGEDDLKTRLILAEVSHPGMFERKVKGKFVFFSPYVAVSSAHTRSWGSGYFPAIGGSVTTAALDMGVMFGCDPILFVGQDLAFGEGETHAPGGVYIAQDVKIDKDRGEIVIEEDYVTLKDRAVSTHKLQWLKGLDGRPVASKFDWVTFHQWFENYVAELKRKGDPTRVINATEGGAYIEGMEHITLAEAIKRHVLKGFDLEGAVEGALAGRKRPDTAAIVSELEETEKRLKEIGRTADCILKDVAAIRKAVKNAVAAPETVRKAERIKRLEDKLFSAAEQSVFIWECLTEHTLVLKEYLRETKEGAPGAKTLEDDIEAIGAAYGKVSEICKRYAPVVMDAAMALRRRAAAD